MFIVYIFCYDLKFNISEWSDYYLRKLFRSVCKLMCEHNPEFKQIFNGEINYTSLLLRNALI